MATTIKYDTRTLRGMGLPDEAPAGGEIISDQIIGHSRWSVIHEIVWRFAETPPGEAWRASYSVGATETQSERPWEFEKTIEATLVREVEKTIKVWESAS